MSWRLGVSVCWTSGMSSYFIAYLQSFHSCLESRWHKEVINVPLKDASRQGVAGRRSVTFRVAPLITIFTLQTRTVALRSVLRIPQKKPTGSWGSARRLPSAVIHQADVPNSNIQIYLGLLARPPDLRRRGNGPPDGAKTHSLSSPLSLSVFSQTRTCTRTHIVIQIHRQIQCMCTHTQYQRVIRRLPITFKGGAKCRKGFQPCTQSLQTVFVCAARTAWDMMCTETVSAEIFLFQFLSDKPVWLHTQRRMRACERAPAERWFGQNFSRPESPWATLSKHRLMIGGEDGSAFHRASYWLKSPLTEMLPDRYLFFERNKGLEMKLACCELSSFCFYFFFFS